MQEKLPAAYDGGAVEPQAVQAGVTSMLERLASNPNMDAEKFEKLARLQFEMIERQDERELAFKQEEARVAYCAAFAEMQGELPSVKKTKENKFAGYKYADYDDIREAINPYLKKHGFFVNHRAVQLKDGDIAVYTRLTHKQGHFEEVEVSLPADSSGSQGKTNKTPIQAKASTITYGEKYGLLSILGLSRGEDKDGGERAPKLVTKFQAEAITQLVMSATDSAKDKFRETYGAANSVTTDKFDGLCAWLRRNQAKEEGDAANV